jgi:hypothetical protein
MLHLYKNKHTRNSIKIQLNFKDIHKKKSANVNVLTVRIGRLTPWVSIANFTLVYKGDISSIFCKKKKKKKKKKKTYYRVITQYFLLLLKIGSSLIQYISTSTSSPPSLSLSLFCRCTPSPFHSSLNTE